MKCVFLLGVVFTVTYAASAATTTTTAATTLLKILYDMKHHKAMIVRKDGCYEYHLNHQDILDTEKDSAKSALEARMLAELSKAMNTQEMDHHHIDHMTQDIQSACVSVPIYSWDIGPTFPMLVSSGSSTFTAIYRTVFQLTIVYSLKKLFDFMA